VSQPLQGHTALVTGAGHRLGAAIVSALAHNHVNVILHYNHSEKQAKALAAELSASGVKTALLQADLSVAEEADGLMLRAVDAMGPVDFLVNNASGFAENLLQDVRAKEICRDMTLEAYAPLALVRALAAGGQPAAVVNILDCRIVDFDRKHISYHLAKQALYSLTRMMADEFAPDLRVNAVAPGVILPPPGEGEAWLRKMRMTNPLQANGTPEDVADAVLFLLQQTFITGQVIFVDGGRHLHGQSGFPS